MKKNILLTAAALLTTLAGAAQWQPAGDRIGTEWGEKLDPQNVLPEYPRPQMTRTHVFLCFSLCFAFVLVAVARH